jgi:Transglutaminase-like superfamily
MGNELDPTACLAPSTYVDSDAGSVRDYARRVLTGLEAASERERAVALFLAVRDGIRYDPYASTAAADLPASVVATTERNWCVPKAILLTALCRASGIAAGLGFSDVRNHLQSEKLRATMGTDLFVFHGYSVIHLDGEWRKVSSAFNRDLCERFGTKVLEWDGTHDALMHPFDEGGARHMEYVRDRGVYIDMPIDEMQAAFAETYPADLNATPSGPDEAFA